MTDSSDRLVYTEPNLYAAEAAGIKFGNGKIATNMTWNPEDLNISVDLQVIVPTRSDCGEVAQNIPVSFSNGLGMYTSFLSGSKVGENNYLTTDYTEASYSEIRLNSVSTTESLGISSIDIRFDAHFYPQVTMKFTDVRGYSLFMPAEEEYVNKLQTKAYNAGNATKPGRAYTNLFKAVFHFPYPKFLLTIKGFYGNKVTFILAVNDFKTSLNGQNGNFDVTISFIGYMYGLYTDVPMSYIMIAPYIDSKDGQLTESSYWVLQSSHFISKASNSSGDGENATQPIPTFLELARNYAELDIKSEDTLGTETEDYYIYQSAYDSLDSIIKEYKDLVNEFGYDAKLSLTSGKTDIYNLYLLNDTQEYSWNKNDRAKELRKKITEHMNKYGGENFNNCVITYPTLLRNEDEAANYTIKPSELVRVELDSDGKKPTHNNGDKIFVVNDKDTYKKAVSGDQYFENVLFSLLTKFKGNHTLVAFNGEQCIKQLTDSLTAIGILRDNKMKDAAQSAVKLFSEKLGYSLTIENVFRMLFAHVECFFHHYLVNTVYKIRDDKTRTFNKFGLDYRLTDSDGIAVNNNSKLLPFPAIYNKRTKELVYPGEDMHTVGMLEVALVEQLHEAAKMCGEEADKVSELMALNERQDYSGQYVSGSGNFPLPISFDGSFKPLTFMDAFCECKNPYTNIPTVKENVTNYNLVDEILYMAYLRYCAYKLCILDWYSYQADAGSTDSLRVKQYFIHAEYENILSAFSSPNKDFKDEVKKLLDDNEGVFYNRLMGVGSDTYLKGRIGAGFSIPYTGNTVLCTGFDTSSYNSSDSLDGYIKRYTKDYLRGVYVLSDSDFDVFKSMHEAMIYTEKNDRYDFKSINYVFDIREAEFDEYGGKIIGLNKVPFNSVYYLSEEGRKRFTEDLSVDNDKLLENCNKDVLNHNDKKNYFNFIKYGRSSSEDYVGLYSPGPWITEQNNQAGKRNLLLSNFFWNQASDEARAFLLLSAYIGSSDNKFLYDDNLTRVGVRVYRLRKLSVLYYGALIHRLRYQVDNLTDLVNMYDKKDKFGITKDIFNERTYTSSSESEFIKYGSYYYPMYMSSRRNRKFTKDAPKLAAISIVDSNVYSDFANGELDKEIINVLSSEYGSGTYKIDNDTKKSLIKLLKACDPHDKTTDNLEGYFLNWVNSDFKKFLDLLKSCIKIERDNDGTVKEVNPVSNIWINFDEHNLELKYYEVPCFKYSEEEDSPNMFLNRLQCDQVTVLLCAPNEETVSLDKDKDKFLKNASNILNEVFRKLDDYYSKQTGDTSETEAIVEQNTEEKHDPDDSSLKKATYYTLKSLYDKWICGYGNFEQFKLPTPHEELEAKHERYEKGDYSGDLDFREMNNFLFVDAFYNDISDKFYCNPRLLYDLIMACVNGDWKNCSIYQFMSKLAQDNKLLMKAFPVYNNFYNTDTINDIFTPHMSYDVANNTMTKRGFGSTYILMYTNQPSKFLNEESKTEIVFRDDGFDIGNSLGYAEKMDTPFRRTEGALNLPVPAFGVTYGMQNQQYFKGMNITMDNPITTNYSIANTLMLSQTGAKGDKNFPMGIGQDIYAIYSNRSYTITVEMMGCANIMPMMYFQLNNVPMFKGAYMIVSVSHSIKAGNMTTTFTGIRQSKYLYPTVNENMILTSIMDRINMERAGRRSRRGAPIYSNVEAVAFTDENITITLDNALGSKYGWVPKSTGEPYPYKRRLSKPKHIILHYTAGSSSVDGSGGKLMPTWVNIWNNSEDGGGSADFAVDDGKIYQFTPNIDDWWASYCNGGRYDPDEKGGRTQHDDEHLHGIGIEMCCYHTNGTSFKDPNHDGWRFSYKVLDNTARLCACLIHKFPSMSCTQLSDLDNILSTHYLVSGKVCPGIKGWNNATYTTADGQKIPNNMNEFDNFKKRVWNYLVEYKFVKGKKVELT